MSDDKDPKNPPKSDGTGADSGTADSATKMGFGELFGHIDQRIADALGKRQSSNATDSGAGTAGKSGEDPESVRSQIRAELAKLSSEKAAADKDAARDVTIEELKQQVATLSEAKPLENVSKLTEFMWGKRKKA